MQTPGGKLRHARERLKLRYRDVTQASAEIALSRENPEFQIGLSRLFDIENRGTLPTCHRMYSLAAIYKLDFRTLLGWYGVDLDHLADDAMHAPVATTTLLKSDPPSSISAPIPDPAFDRRQTIYLSRLIKSWGKLPSFVLASSPPAHNRYAFVGFDDSFMHPIIRPGALVQINPRKRKILAGGWSNEWERPIYLIEHRSGFRCAWCSRQGDQLVLEPHPASGHVPEVYSSSDAEVLGQVIAIALRLDQVQVRHKRFAEARG